MHPIGPVLVTGAYGLIGHAAVLELRRAGVPVVASDKLSAPPDDAAFEAEGLDIHGVEEIARVLRRHGVRSIVHCAGISGPMLAQGEPHRIFTVNVGGTLDLLEAARLSGVRRVVVLSSASAYGRHLETVREDAPLTADDPYGASKAAGEAVARGYGGPGGLEIVILRPCWVYGPRRRTPCVILTMLRDAIAGKPTRLPYGQGGFRQFVHVEDVARAVSAALSGEAAIGRAFNISDGMRPTFADVAAEVQRLVPTARIDLGAAPVPDDVDLGPLSIAAARDGLGWRPSISLRRGIAIGLASLQSS
ncbi:MAG: NAD(P)-dependent oxidoreductase [Alsobacter sp.]